MRDLAAAARRAFDAARARLHLTAEDAADAIEVPARPPGRLALNALCRLDYWDDPEWMRVWADVPLQLDESRLHRKGFEWCQCAWGLRRLGALGDDKVVVGVGTGHEPLLFWLARHARRVVATDLYSGEFTSSIATEADPGFLHDPARYAPAPYPAERLLALPADGRRLPFRSGSVDVVYSLSSIEHFGGHAAAGEAMREVARILKPGGVAAIATEYILEGGVHAEYFTAEELERHVIRGNGLVLVEPLDPTPPDRAFLDDPVWLPHVEVTPHIVLAIGALRWTSVVLFFRKPTRAELVRAGARDVARRVLGRLPRRVPGAAVQAGGPRG